MEPSERAEKTLEQIVSVYSPMLLRLASTRLGSPADAEDAVQEVFLRLLSHPVEFRSSEHEKAWLIRATLHRATDMLRRAEKKNLPLEAAGELPTWEKETDAILDAVRELPQKYSSVLYLHYYEGYTAKEIGRFLGLPSATVGTRLARGRERLKNLLQEEIL